MCRFIVCIIYIHRYTSFLTEAVSTKAAFVQVATLYMRYGNKTFRHPLKKTVRHQDISVPLKKSVKSAPHFLSNKRDYLFKNKINENLKKTSRCRTVFFNGCRKVLFPYRIYSVATCHTHHTGLPTVVV
jgi:hypothetical protein